MFKTWNNKKMKSNSDLMNNSWEDRTTAVCECVVWKDVRRKKTAEVKTCQSDSVGTNSTAVDPPDAAGLRALTLNSHTEQTLITQLCSNLYRCIKTQPIKTQHSLLKQEKDQWWYQCTQERWLETWEHYDESCDQTRVHLWSVYSTGVQTGGKAVSGGKERMMV